MTVVSSCLVPGPGVAWAKDIGLVSELDKGGHGSTASNFWQAVCFLWELATLGGQALSSSRATEDVKAS